MIVIDSAYTKGFEEYAARSENLYVVDVRLLQTNPITFWTLLHSVSLTLLRYEGHGRSQLAWQPFRLIAEDLRRSFELKK